MKSAAAYVILIVFFAMVAGSFAAATIDLSNSTVLHVRLRLINDVCSCVGIPVKMRRS